MKPPKLLSKAGHLPVHRAGCFHRRPQPCQGFPEGPQAQEKSQVTACLRSDEVGIWGGGLKPSPESCLESPGGKCHTTTSTSPSAPLCPSLGICFILPYRGHRTYIQVSLGETMNTPGPALKGDDMGSAPHYIVHPGEQGVGQKTVGLAEEGPAEKGNFCSCNGDGSARALAGSARRHLAAGPPCSPWSSHQLAGFWERPGSPRDTRLPGQLAR